MEILTAAIMLLLLESVCYFMTFHLVLISSFKIFVLVVIGYIALSKHLLLGGTGIIQIHTYTPTYLPT